MPAFRANLLFLGVVLFGPYAFGSGHAFAAVPMSEKKSAFREKYRESVAGLENGIQRGESSLIEASSLELLGFTKAGFKDREVAAKASYILAMHYYKGEKDDYDLALKFLSRAIYLAPDGSALEVLAGSQYGLLEKHLKKINDLIADFSYKNYMKAAAMYAGPYLRNYKAALVIYNRMSSRYPLMLPEILYMKASLYMEKDIKIRDLNKAEEILLQIMKYHKNFHMYSDVAFHLSSIEMMKLQKLSSEGSHTFNRKTVKKALDFLLIAEKAYQEGVKKKTRGRDPEYMAMLKDSKENLEDLPKGR